MSYPLVVRRSLALVLLFVVPALTGCETNRWRDTFTPNPALRDFSPPPTPEVTIRTLEWERLAAFDDESRARLAQTDIPVDEWTREKQRFEFAEFLRTLRITEQPEQVLLLGSSDFISDGQPNLFTGELESFATSIGADYAVATSRHLGTRRSLIRVPVTTHSQTSGTAYFDNRRRRSDRAVYNETTSETTWVPREVDIDAFHTITYFFRLTTPEEFSRLNPQLWRSR
jgi:hypothetical protein